MEDLRSTNYDVVAIVHRFYSEGKRKRGGFDRVLDGISVSGKKILLIEHSLVALKEGRNLTDKTVVSTKNETDFTDLEQFDLSSGNTILRWLKEFVFNITFVLRNVKNKPVLMVADPLNGTVGVFLRWKFSKKYYHTIDFSENRFGNKIINYVYTQILLMCLNTFDVIGVVSGRIRSKISFTDNISKKIVDVPNSLEYEEIHRRPNLANIIIYTGGAIIKKYNYEDVIEIISEVKKQFPDVILYAVGGLDENPLYVSSLKEKIKKLGLQNNVVFTGFISKEEVHNLYMKSKVGLSFYSKESSYYTYFGDSQKIREYAMYGIPSVTDGSSATDGEMSQEGAGFITQDNHEAAQKIIDLLSDSDLYEKLSEDSTAWAKKTDKKKVIHNLMTKLLLSDNGEGRTAPVL